MPPPSETDDTAADRVASRTLELIDIPSVSWDEAALQRHVEQLMPSRFAKVFGDDTIAFFSASRTAGKPFVVLAGHTDTVPIANNVPGTRNGDVIFGRGASDMKSGLAVMIELARWIDVAQPDLAVDLGFLFFGREEIASEHCPLLPALETSPELRSADLAILMEPTANALEAGCQGNLNLTVTFRGVAAHTARPWMGNNAVHAAIGALSSVASAAPKDVEVDGLVFREVANITGIRGGVARNVLPDVVECDINVRFPPTRTEADVAAEWRAKFEGHDVHVEIVSSAPPAPVVIDHPLATRLLQAGAGAPMPKQAWTNAADFAIHDVPAINYGPGDPAFAHRDDEQIHVDALTESFETLKRFVSA